MFIQVELPLERIREGEAKQSYPVELARPYAITCLSGAHKGCIWYQDDLFAWSAERERKTTSLACQVVKLNGMKPADATKPADSSESSPQNLSLIASIEQFSEYVPKSKSRYLRRDFMAFVGPEPKLHKLAFELWKQGKSRLGDVIQLSEAQILAMRGASSTVVTELRNKLAFCGLRLDMKIVGWKALPPPSMGY